MIKGIVMKFFSFVQMFALIFLNSLLFGTVYEDAEDGDTKGWMVYDQTPAGATISNIEDNGNRVIQLQGDGTDNGYLLGDWIGGKNVWRNQKEPTITWRMKYDEDFVVYVSVETLKGQRYLYYTNKSGSWKRKNYIHHSLGSNANDGTWRTFSRNLEDDLRYVESDNMITSVNAFLIRGSGLVDNIELSRTFVKPIELISSENGERVLMVSNNNHTLTIFDTSNKNNSKIIARYELEERTNQIKFSKNGRKLYISLDNNRFKILDIENPHPTIPKIIGSYPIDVYGIISKFTVSEDESKVYLATYALDFEIIDISDMKNLRQTGSLHENVRPIHPTSYTILDMILSSDNQKVYVRDSVGAIYVIDIRDVINPKLIKSIGGFTGF